MSCPKCISDHCYYHGIVGGMAGAHVRSQGVYLAPLSRVPSPSHTLAYQEIPSRHVHFWGDWSSSACYGYQDRVEGNFNTVPGWHDLAFHFNVTFADGHAANVEMQGTIRPAPNLGQYPPGECGSSISPYDCLRCVTFRGPEWNMDTLPARAILTPWSANDRSSGRFEHMQVVP